MDNSSTIFYNTRFSGSMNPISGFDGTDIFIKNAEEKSFEILFYPQRYSKTNKTKKYNK